MAQPIGIYNIDNNKSHSILKDNIVNNLDFWCSIEGDPANQIKRKKYIICLLDTEHDHYEHSIDKNLWKFWFAYYIHKREENCPLSVIDNEYYLACVWPLASKPVATQVVSQYTSSVNKILFNKISDIPLADNTVHVPVKLLNDNKWLGVCCDNATEIGFELLTRWIKRRDAKYGDNLIGYCANNFSLPEGVPLPLPAVPITGRVSSMVYAKKLNQNQRSSIKWSKLQSNPTAYIYDQGAPSFTKPVIGDGLWELHIGLGGKYDKGGKNSKGAILINNNGAYNVKFNRGDFEGILGYREFELNNGNNSPFWKGKLEYLQHPNQNISTIDVIALISDPSKNAIKGDVAKYLAGIPGVSQILQSSGQLYNYLSSIKGGNIIKNILTKASSTFKVLNTKGLSPTTDIKRLGDWSQSYEVKQNAKYLFATGDYLAAGIACYFNDVTTLLKIPKLVSNPESGYLIMYNSDMAKRTTPLQCTSYTGYSSFSDYKSFKEARNNTPPQLGGQMSPEQIYIIDLKKVENIKEDILEAVNIPEIVRLILNPGKYNLENDDKIFLEDLKRRISNNLLLTMVTRLYWKLKISKETNKIVRIDELSQREIDDLNLTLIEEKDEPMKLYRDYYNNINLELLIYLINKVGYSDTDLFETKYPLEDVYSEAELIDPSFNPINFDEYIGYFTNIRSLSSKFIYYEGMEEEDKDIVSDIPDMTDDMTDDMTGGLFNIKNLYNGFYNLICYNLLEEFVKAFVEGLLEQLPPSSLSSLEVENILIISSKILEIQIKQQEQFNEIGTPNILKELYNEYKLKWDAILKLNSRPDHSTGIFGKMKGDNKRTKNLYAPYGGKKNGGNVKLLKDKPIKPTKVTRNEPIKPTKPAKPTKSKQLTEEKSIKSYIILDKQYRIKELKEVAKNNNIKITKKVESKYISLNKKELITVLNKRKLI